MKIVLLDQMLGTVPKDKDTYEKYIAPKAPIVQNGIDEVETVPEDTTSTPGYTGFMEDDDGPFIFNYMIKGFLKEAGNTLKDVSQLNIKALRSKIDAFVFTGPRKIRLPKPEGIVARSLRAQTAMGPRVTVVQSDYIPEGTLLECTITLLENKEIKEETLRAILDYGEFKGLGQFRNGSYGRFTYELTKIEELATV